MRTGDLIPTPNVIDPGDVELFFAGVQEGLISLQRGLRFNTLDRPTTGGRWGLLSRSQEGGWYNAEYLPQLAAYVDAILHRGYPSQRVLFELPASALQLDLAVLDDDGRVVVLGEAKRSATALTTLRETVIQRFSATPPGPESKTRGDEARHLAWRIWTVQPDFVWLIGPGTRDAFEARLHPLDLIAAPGLPAASALGLDHCPPAGALPPPQLA
jgi:hypothetical protein